MNIPVYVNCRDRVRDLRRLVCWLENAGHDIILLDNASTFEPLVEYLRATPHDVVCLGRNLGARAIWEANLAPAGWYVYTDPDCLPTAACPHDAVEHLRDLLERFPMFPKAGLGLYLDDVPASMPSLNWERSLVTEGQRLLDGVYSSLIDTSFALYRPGATFGYTAIRTGGQYRCRHMGWYIDRDNLDDEDAYYLAHAVAGVVRDERGNITFAGSSWAEGKQ